MEFRGGTEEVRGEIAETAENDRPVHDDPPFEN